MTIDNIRHSLSERFAEPLPDYYSRRIIFWFDSEREFEPMLDELELPGVKLLRLTGDNFFEAKRLLLSEDTRSNYLVYDPLSYSRREDNWLRDIQLYSDEFRADLVSMQMDELHIPQTTQIRRAMKHYGKFFENKERCAKLAAFGTNYENPGQLHISIMAVLSGARQNTVHSVLQTILCGSLFEDENEPLARIEKFGSLEAFYGMVSRYTGYASEDFSLYELATHIFLTAFSSIGDERVLAGLEKYITPANQTACYAFIDEWAASPERGRLFDMAEDICSRFDLASRLARVDTDVLMKSDSLPCIDEALIGRFLTEIGDDVIKTDEILSAYEARRTSKWHDRFACYYDGLHYIAKMQEFHYANITCFHYGNYTDLWDKYTGELYLMDTYYRQLHLAFRKSLTDSSGGLDDLFKKAVSAAERIYKNWYLSELNGQWCSLIKDDVKNNFALDGLPQQSRLFNESVLPTVRSSGRVFVIISDALRYEVAAELSEKLTRETNGTAKLTAVQSVFPSITKMGMAALLPHSQLSVTADGKVLIDGEPTDTTESRGRILNKYSSGSCAVTYEALLAMNQTQRRELVSGAETVYIYHNEIDAVGDKATTEKQVFEACSKALNDLIKLVRMIVNSLSGSNILITSDHGFLYSHEPLAESDKAGSDLVSGNIIETGRRYILSETSSSSDILMNISMTEYSDSLAGFAPYEDIRIKKQGGGMNFVHGGVSLQECCVPLIVFKNIRTTSKRFVDIEKVTLGLISMTRKISNNIFTLDFMQKEAVGGKIVSATYEIYLSDKLSNPVSDIQTVIADKTGEPQDRVTKLRFTLKSLEFDSSAVYYLNIVDKDTGAVIESTEFSVQIAFANDFDF